MNLCYSPNTPRLEVRGQPERGAVKLTFFSLRPQTFQSDLTWPEKVRSWAEEDVPPLFFILSTETFEEMDCVWKDLCTRTHHCLPLRLWTPCRDVLLWSEAGRLMKINQQLVGSELIRLQLHVSVKIHSDICEGFTDSSLCDYWLMLQTETRRVLWLFRLLNVKNTPSLLPLAQCEAVMYIYSELSVFLSVSGAFLFLLTVGLAAPD